MTLRYVHHYRDQHGVEKWYFRRPGYKKVRLPRPDSAEFLSAYQQALAGVELVKLPIGRSRAARGTIAAAIAAYFQHTAFLGLAVSTRAQRRAILEQFRAGNGDKPFGAATRVNIAKLLGTKKPFAARNWLKALRGLYVFGAETGLRKDDPTQGIRLARLPRTTEPGGFHSWTEEEIACYERTHPIGTRARLAMALLLHTAARRGDLVRLGPQHRQGNTIVYRQQKTGRQLVIPIHPELARVLAEAPGGHLTWLVTEAGAGFTHAGFGNRFRKWCDAAELPQCAAHGLRKAQLRRLAEAGCTAPQIAAISGHRSLSEVQRYIEAAEQRKLAEAAIATISRTRIGSPPDR